MADSGSSKGISPRPFAIAGAVMLVASLAVDLVVGHHGVFGFDGIPGFFAAFGFVGGLAIIGIAKAIGAVLNRPDTYYDGRE